MKKVELLAPVGKWDVLEAVIAAGADAVYLGGKKYNMRLHRKDYNFTEEELREVLSYAHARGKKVYVTVNNMLTNAEVSEIGSYLLFLEEIGADGLIVQDLGVVQLAKKLGLKTPLHASVMMNAHNLEALAFLQELGIKRVILGRELSLAEIRILHEQLPSLELEYFTHGDMCFTQSGQCYHSGMLFGKSSNRGRCLKPCRWPFALWDRVRGEAVATLAPGPYFLAVKDMCLLPYLPEVIASGITSLKIEGRMRTASYLGPLIGFYRRALDRYYADPAGYYLPREELLELEKMRVRDLSPLFAFGNPGPAAIGYTGEREPQFFSSAVKEPETTAEDLGRPLFPELPVRKEGPRPLLAVKVGSRAAALAALAAGAEVVYTSGESFRSQGRPWSRADYEEVVARAREHGAKVVIGLPRITMPAEMERIHMLLEDLEELRPDGVLVGNLGTIFAASKETSLPLYADYSCNIANREAASLLKDYRLVLATAPIELCFEEVALLARDFPLDLEVVVHGPLPAMVSDHCLPAALLRGGTRYQVCPGPCEERQYGLRDAAGLVHAVECDHSCRNFIFLAHELALLPYLKSVLGLGARSLRLEVPTYTPEEVAGTVRLYKEQLRAVWADPERYRFPAAAWAELKGIRNQPFGPGPYAAGVKVSGEEGLLARS